MADRRIVLREDHLGRATGFYVGWRCRYRDELNFTLRPIGGVSTFDVELLDSGEFRYSPTDDQKAAVVRYLQEERAAFIGWCALQDPPVDPSGYPEHAVLSVAAGPVSA